MLSHLRESIPPSEDSLKEMADFGYRRVPVDEKGKLVHRHFDSIARKYDFMNTLLSFGLHLLWKRWAIRAARLEAGNKLIDVCGGTASKVSGTSASLTRIYMGCRPFLYIAS